MEKYFEILETIKKERIDITKLYLLSCLDNSYSNEERIEKMNYCYDLWLDADVDLDLGRLADIVEQNWGEIQQDELLDTDIIEMCLDI